MEKKKIRMRIGESVFCISYLLFDLIAGKIFMKYGLEQLFFLYGILTLILGFGDAFHLIPRVIKNIIGETEKVKWWMNLGLIVTSITMTIFYIILFYIWEIKYVSNSNSILIFIWITAILRIIICLLPQNNWFSGGNKKMSIYRNVVFAIMGIVETVLFMMLGGTYGITMSICITLSFTFYIPVALFGKDNPKLGILMIPKTIMYIIMISLGLSLL